jgi:uncharacterized protein (TIGR03382 family)
MSRPSVAAFAAFAGLAAAAGTAAANGRPPATVSVHTRAGADREIYVSTTFGFLISRDDGCSFRWVCENAIGYAGTFDPKYRIARDGTIYATTSEHGLRVSRDGGCEFITAGLREHPELETWVDAIDLGPDDDVWIGTAKSGRTNEVYHSTDAGRTFTAMGLESSTVWWKSIRVAPSLGSRVYISGYQVAARADLDPLAERPPGPATFLMRTDDAGAHWSQVSLEGIQLATVPVVLVEAVDPQDPDVVLIRSVGTSFPGDRLYRTDSGGAVWEEVLATPDPIRDVVFTHDHRVLAATIGSGIHVSTDGGRTFTQLDNQPQTACLTERSDGTLFACGANWEPDFKAIARSTDAASWTTVFRFVELAAPLQCPHHTVQYETCELKSWPVLREQFGAAPPECAALTPDAPGPPPGGDGCCDASGGAPATAIAGIALVVLAGRLRRRRRCA